MDSPPLIDRKTAAILVLIACGAVSGVVWAIRHPSKPPALVPAQTQSTTSRLEKGKNQAQERTEASPPVQAPVPASVHEYFYDRISQLYEERFVNMKQGYGGTSLEVCFLQGYTGIGHADQAFVEGVRVNSTLSNRKRAECDAILERQESLDAAQEAQEKKLDEAYDKEHGLSPGGRPQH